MAPCECQQVTRIEKLLGAARVPLRYRKASMDGLYLTKGNAVRDYLEAFAQSAEPGKEPCALVLTGPVGVGKTYAGYAVLNALIQRGLPGVAETVPNVLDTLRATQLSEKGHELLHALQQIPALLLDDLGAHRDSAFVLERLFMVINQRYNEMLPTIVTMNGVEQDFMREESLSLGWDRLFSRLHEMCGGDFLEMVGGDRRLAGVEPCGK